MVNALVMMVPAQPHENNDWRGQLRHQYRLTFDLPMAMVFEGKANPTHALHVSVGRDGLVPTDGTESLWLAEPPIALLIKQLRRKFYPGDDEVFRFDITKFRHFSNDWTPIARAHYADTRRTRYLYVLLEAKQRAELSVWLDQLYIEGVLT